MSIKINVIANYVGRIYVIATGIIILPLYMMYLGGEAFGLVGLFAVVQSWMQLLNMGLSPALGREAAKAQGSSTGYYSFYRVLVSYELIFLMMSSLLALVVVLASAWFTSSWLNIENLTFDEAYSAIVVLLFASIMRFQGSLYRSGIVGFEQQVYVNLVDIVFVSLRYLGGLLIVAFFSNNVLHFFVYQLILSILELLLLRQKIFASIPQANVSSYKFYWGIVKPTLPFAMGVAYSAGIWIFITQIDKAILSSVLSLSEFGYYSLVAIVVGGILQISRPFTEAVRPRMTALAEAGKAKELHELYLLGTQFVASVCFSASIVIAVNAKALVYLWTDNQSAAIWSENVLFWFSLGNGILVVGAFQFFLQFAHGKLKLHVLGSTISALIQVPVIAYAALEYGAIGAAKAWFGVRLVFFLIWVPVVHRAFAKGVHVQWLFKAVLPVVLIAIMVVAVWPRSEEVFMQSRGALLLDLGVQSLVVLSSALCCIAWVRRFVFDNLRRLIT